tara:strand:+ start:213 stop:317 length:105 start_codon:yes stop_codon:yes gene_type:complete
MGAWAFAAGCMIVAVSNAAATIDIREGLERIIRK